MKGITQDQRRDLILSVGTHRSQRPLSPIEVGQLIKVVLANGGTLSELSTDLHLENSTMLSRFLRLTKLAPDAQHHVDWGNSPSTISLTVGSEIARLVQQSDQEFVATSALEHRLTTAEIRQITELVIRSRVQAKEATESILKLRPEIERIHVFVGTILQPKLQGKLKDLSQLDRNELVDVALRKVLRGKVTARIGVTRFTLICDDERSKEIRGLPGGFERVVNSSLERALGV